MRLTSVGLFSRVATAEHVAGWNVEADTPPPLVANPHHPRAAWYGRQAARVATVMAASRPGPARPVRALVLDRPGGLPQLRETCRSLARLLRDEWWYVSTTDGPYLIAPALAGDEPLIYTPAPRSYHVADARSMDLLTDTRRPDGAE